MKQQLSIVDISERGHEWGYTTHLLPDKERELNHVQRTYSGYLAILQHSNRNAAYPETKNKQKKFTQIVIGKME